MREISVGPGRVTVVDDADYEMLSQLRWSSYKPATASCWYVSCTSPADRKGTLMHRLLTGAPKGMDVDHIDGDGLNNRRYNLRVCNRGGNMKNRRTFKRKPTAASQFKGVSLTRGRDRRWKAQVTSDGVTHVAEGFFATAEAAARAYDELARKHHGEFARLNFPDERPTKAQGPIRRLISRIVSRVSLVQRKSGLFHRNTA